MRLLPAILGSCLLIQLTAADGDPSLPNNVDLIAEHRQGKEASILDSIASLFGAGETKKPVGPPPSRPGPIYRPPQNPPIRRQQQQNQQQAASFQRPLAVKPPVSFKKPFYPPVPTRLATSETNRNSVVQPGFGGGQGNEPWKISQPANMAQIKDLQVQCEKDMMRVRIIFDRPFYGMVFSKGHYSNINCVHVPSGLGQTQATFDIAMGQCGMSTGGNTPETYNGGPSPQGSFIENTIIVQYDPLLQEVWDQARKMRCTWYDFYEKAVTFKPYQVDMLDPVTANFLGDNLRCWMQVQVGKGPYASEVSGIVKIGQTMTMVLGVKDDENKFDMMVRNCVAHDGTRAPIQLVDEKGCVVRDKIMSPFKKIKNFDATANVLAFAYFQAFKFPDSMNVHFQCVVQVCRGSCPDPACGGQTAPLSAAPDVDSYGAPQAPAIDSYGAPQAPAIDSYGAPAAAPIQQYNRPQYQQQGQRRVSVVQGRTNPTSSIPLKPEAYKAPAQANFQKRTGSASEDLEDTNAIAGGKPRSLDFEDGESMDAVVSKMDFNAVQEEEESDAINAIDTPAEVEAADQPKSRRRRTATVPVDGNGNRILHVVRRETTEDDIDETTQDSTQSADAASKDDVEQADIETERVIRVVAPSDVQFQLNDKGDEEVVINTNSVPAEAVCIDTSAFVGVTITMLMLLIVALITIVFLWLRIRAIDRKNLL
jgi:hypothetical protein